MLTGKRADVNNISSPPLRARPWDSRGRTLLCFPSVHLLTFTSLLSLFVYVFSFGSELRAPWRTVPPEEQRNGRKAIAITRNEKKNDGGLAGLLPFDLSLFPCFCSRPRLSVPFPPFHLDSLLSLSLFRSHSLTFSLAFSLAFSQRVRTIFSQFETRQRSV